MASGRMEFHADSIMQHTNFSFVIPNDFIIEEIKNPRHYDRPTKSLILLPGLTGTATDCLFGGVAQEMAKQYNLAIFMPTTGNSFYLDRGYEGGNYATFVGGYLLIGVLTVYLCLRIEEAGGPSYRSWYLADVCHIQNPPRGTLRCFHRSQHHSGNRRPAFIKAQRRFGLLWSEQQSWYGNSTLHWHLHL